MGKWKSWSIVIAMVSKEDSRQIKCIAIIPARGGSKSIPGKNLKNFLGIPLLVHSIRAAQKCSLIDRIIVSTDSPEIADLARTHGAEVPFLRPKTLSEDDTPDLPVFSHCLSWLLEQGEEPELIVHLRPTSPMRRVSDIVRAIEKLNENDEADSIRAVIEPNQNPYKMWKEEGGFLLPLIHDGKDPFLGENFNKPRQVLPKVLWQTGYLDVIRVRTILNKNSMTGKKILSLEIPQEFSLDLDTLFDWEWSESFWKGRKLES